MFKQVSLPNRTIKKLETLLKILERGWKKIVIYVTLTSLVGLFIASFVLDKNIPLETINGWVSIILGLVATILSIISLILSFYNVEKTNESNEYNNNILRVLQERIEQKVSQIPAQTAQAVRSSLSQSVSQKKVTEDIDFVALEEHHV